MSESRSLMACLITAVACLLAAGAIMLVTSTSGWVQVDGSVVSVETVRGVTDTGRRSRGKQRKLDVAVRPDEALEAALSPADANVLALAREEQAQARAADSLQKALGQGAPQAQVQPALVAQVRPLIASPSVGDRVTLMVDPDRPSNVRITAFGVGDMFALLCVFAGILNLGLAVRRWRVDSTA